MSDHSDDETLSVCSKASTASVSNLSMKCPYCDWNKKGKRLFNHIVNHHTEQIYSALGTSKLIKKNIEEDCLLELNMTWEGFQDDDEFKEFPEQRQLHIFGCLGCNQTYQTKSRAKAHWKKSEKCQKDHLKYTNKYLDKVLKAEKKQGDKTWIDELSNKELFDAVERLARWYHRVVHLDLPYLLKHDLNRGIKFNQEYLQHTLRSASELKSREDRLSSYKKYTKHVRDLEIYLGRTITLPFEYKIPSPWTYTSTPEDDGLAPVGTDYEAVGQAAVQKQQEQQKAIEQPLLLKKQLLLQQTLEASPEPTLTHETISKPLSRSTTPLRSLETITEEPIKKEKRPSITTLNNKDLATMFRAPSPAPQQRFPSIIGNTKRQIKISS